MITPTSNTYPIESGDFINIPTWQAVGQVQSVTGAAMGGPDAVQVLLQEHPDQPERKWRSFRLEPGEYEIVG